MNKYDSNYGIDFDWIKITIHVFRDRKGLWNLPRVFWANKNWTL
jgi:hypothetical protein